MCTLTRNGTVGDYCSDDQCSVCYRMIILLVHMGQFGEN